MGGCAQGRGWRFEVIDLYINRDQRAGFLLIFSNSVVYSSLYIFCADLLQYVSTPSPSPGNRRDTQPREPMGDEPRPSRTRAGVPPGRQACVSPCQACAPTCQDGAPGTLDAGSQSPHSRDYGRHPGLARLARGQASPQARPQPRRCRPPRGWAGGAAAADPDQRARGDLRQRPATWTPAALATAVLNTGDEEGERR